MLLKSSLMIGVFCFALSLSCGKSADKPWSENSKENEPITPIPTASILPLPPNDPYLPECPNVDVCIDCRQLETSQQQIFQSQSIFLQTSNASCAPPCCEDQLPTLDECSSGFLDEFINDISCGPATEIKNLSFYHSDKTPQECIEFLEFFPLGTCYYSYSFGDNGIGESLNGDVLTPFCYRQKGSCLVMYDPYVTSVSLEIFSIEKNSKHIISMFNQMTFYNSTQMAPSPQLLFSGTIESQNDQTALLAQSEVLIDIIEGSTLDPLDPAEKVLRTSKARIYSNQEDPIFFSIYGFMPITGNYLRLNAKVDLDHNDIFDAHDLQTIEGNEVKLMGSTDYTPITNLKLRIEK